MSRAPDPLRRQRLAPFLIVSTLILGVCLLGGLSGPPGTLSFTLPIGDGILVPSGWFITLFIGLLGLGIAAALLFPRDLSFKRACVVVMTLSIAARVLMLPHPASDDVNRYLWEGRILAHGFSPYSHAPEATDDPEVDIFRDPDDPIWRGINHPTYTAIYPPLMLILLAGVASVSYSALAVKVVMVLFDLGTLVMLLLLLRRRRVELRWALLYGLSPVTLFAFAGEGHNDAAQLFFVVLALHLSRQQRWRWTWLVLGLAVQAKVIALLFWPFFMRRESWRHLWTGLLVAAGPVLFFVPFDKGAIFDSFFAFGFDMAFNGPVHTAFRALVDSTQLATILCQLCFLVAFCTGLVLFHPRRPTSPSDDATSGIFFTVGAVLLLSPTVHFWYVSWILPFLVLRPTASWLALTATIAFTFVPYGLEASTGTWSYPWWGVWAVWTPPILLMAHNLHHCTGRLRLKGRLKTAQEKPQSISVVVPTVEEADHIASCLAPLIEDPLVREVIVVDGGSRDETRQLALDAGAVVIDHDVPYDRGGGRGGQIAAGVSKASADVVAVVHADTVVSAGTFERVVDRLACNPEVIGGAVGSVFDGQGLTLRLLELANDFRAAFLGISFGDQLQFFRRAVYDTGLFPNIPLMEDVELSLRLHTLGRSCFLWGGCTVSPRRWQRGDSGSRVMLVLGLTGGYLARRLFGQPDTVSMYRRYYGDDR